MLSALAAPQRDLLSIRMERLREVVMAQDAPAERSRTRGHGGDLLRVHPPRERALQVLPKGGRGFCAADAPHRQ